jgi:nitrogen fixation-related uncharacterized protein
MDWNIYIIFGALIATTFFVAAAIALHWAHKNGQFSNLDQGATSIFDEDEPLGQVTDQFPVSRNRGTHKAN